MSKINPGDRLRSVKASEWNSFVDASNANKNPLRLTKPTNTRYGDNIIWGRKAAGTGFISSYTPCRLGASLLDEGTLSSDPQLDRFTVDVHRIAADEDLGFIGVPQITPSEDHLVPIVVDGVCRLNVSVGDTSHRYAMIDPNGGGLASNTWGPFQFCHEPNGLFNQRILCKFSHCMEGDGSINLEADNWGLPGMSCNGKAGEYDVDLWNPRTGWIYPMYLGSNTPVRVRYQNKRWEIISPPPPIYLTYNGAWGNAWEIPNASGGTPHTLINVRPLDEAIDGDPYVLVPSASHLSPNQNYIAISTKHRARYLRLASDATRGLAGDGYVIFNTDDALINVGVSGVGWTLPDGTAT